MSDTVLVTGATGKQGGATARALVAQGVPVRALVRDPGGERAAALAGLGIELVQGDLLDPGSVREAVTGVRAVFSVQLPDLGDGAGDSELRQGRNLVEAAKAAGVRQFVHTSVTGAGRHEEAPGWAEGRWAGTEDYWTTKAALEDAVRAAGFEHWTLLKPGFFMENFVRPSVYWVNGTEDRLQTVLRPDTELPLVTVRDIGAAAAAALTDPERFHRAEIELASDRLTVKEVVAVLSDVLGVPLELPDVTADELVARGVHRRFLIGQQWSNEVSRPAHPDIARSWGLPTTGLREWAESTRI
ncbi:uncharacterized protein YbjT (DUF2867 family) [Crossiella equi]|uniref:Uncharacterized protein YbjT (DUF2867 family) n=1 Tax=Crossiella equi TaxID=130796 RepID=A0ABS5AQR4_9PSEU|nr:NmrA/HSCARG family protein [Crossiella equi]MBP2478895.1 uncharacterized protein YbjT (DUF2867 family) [Crossiella equi]